MEIVAALRIALAEQVGQQRFDLWFGSSTRIQWDEHTLTVGVPNRFFLDFVRTTFRNELEAACTIVLGKCPPLKFRVDPVTLEAPTEAASAPRRRRQANGAAAVASTDEAAPPSADAGQELPATVALDAAADAAPSISRRKFQSLASFITGQSNRLAFVSADMVARSPGQISPLVIHGPTSVGKTHLLEGIWTAVRRSCRGSAAVYLSAEQFTTQFVEAIRSSGLPNFRRKYRGVGLLIIDDLQFLAGKQATQVELLHTIDTLLREGRQLVFSADRPPADLPELGPELNTRLSSGMVCRIDPPDYATRLGIVGQLAQRMGINLPAEVQRFVALRLTTHARELSGALCRLQATSQALEQPITMALAEEALAEMIQQHSRVVRLVDIQKAVCEFFGLEATSLQTDRKSKRVSHPRMLAMWLARKHTRAALSEIGEFFGGRCHSTVISAQKRVDGWMALGTPLQLAERSWTVDEAIRQVERQLLAL